jgi:hypothetical protein
MKKKPPIALSDEFVPGDQISLEDWREWNIAISEHGYVSVYLGSLLEGSQLFAVSAAARSGIPRNEAQFVEVNRGCISIGDFFRGSTRYKVLQDCLVRWPRGSDAYFGVLNRESNEEDRTLTRQVFGATYRELNDFLDIFATVVDGYHSRSDRYPRTTFSKTRDNDCDLTGVWIPCKFPYIAFGPSEYFKGHVSLYGFYCLLAFLCDQHVQLNVTPGNRLYQELIAAGAEQELLDWMLGCGIPLFRPATF